MTGLFKKPIRPQPTPYGRDGVGESGCAADLVLENRTGITFGIGDIEKCAFFLEGLCNDKSRLIEMGASSIVLIKYFTFTHIVNSITKVLANMTRVNIA